MHKRGRENSMAHRLQRTGYPALVERLNRFPQGAPTSELLYAILKLLFTEREAGLVALLPVRPFTVEVAARRWRMGPLKAQRVLDELAGRAILLDSIDPDGIQSYVLPPPMAGFFEFSLMRVRNNLDQIALSELFYQYLNVEDDFIKTLFAPTGVPLGRVFVQEPALPAPADLHILDYELASHIIRSASNRAVSICYCRHKMQHASQACNSPMVICMTFNGAADSLIRHGFAREVCVSENLDLLQKAWENNLVQCAENVRERVSFICNCCGCCCEALLAARRFGFLTPVATTNFIISVDESLCTGCGKCVDACPVEAMSLVNAYKPQQPRLRKARLHEDACLGCGVCVRTCPHQALKLQSRTSRVITPVDSVHRVVWMAIERGCLPELIFDNQALYSHRAMAAILGAILKLPPARQVLASQQLKSRYLERLITWGEQLSRGKNNSV
jgi:ferredoxin